MTPSLIALDWGTSALRAWLVARDGAALGERALPLGIMNVANGDFAGAFDQAVGDWRRAYPGLPVIASGMIGSRQGWREAPYVSCPAEPAALAQGLVTVPVEGGVLHIVPGVSQIDADGVPDVMRGEETQIAGLGIGAGQHRVVLPGTHSKWALCEGAVLARFASFMTGEVFAVMAQHSILGRLFTGEAIDADGFQRGLTHAARAPERQGGLLHRLFSARTLGLFNAMPSASLRGYLSGLLIGSEVEEAIALFGGTAPKQVTIVGSGALTSLYEQALAARGIAVEPAPPDAARMGLVQIARAAGLAA